MTSYKKLFRFLSAVEIIAVCAVLVGAFWFQFVDQSPPCPLCLLQRIGLLSIGFCLLLNVRYGMRLSHYSLALLASVLTGLIAMRQVLLHIAPHDPGFGPPFLGYHLYTWVFIVAVASVIYFSIVICFASQYHKNLKDSEVPHEAKTKWLKTLGHIAFLLYVIIITANVVSTFLECGLKKCPSDPTTYIKLKKL